MNRADLQRLADERAADALALLDAGRWSAAYYLAECALKACIAKRVRAEDFPDKKLALDSYTHDIVVLLKVALLTAIHDAHRDASQAFAANWAVVRRWNESARYSSWTEAAARELHRAVTHPTDGVLPWLKRYW